MPTCKQVTLGPFAIYVLTIVAWKVSPLASTPTETQHEAVPPPGTSRMEAAGQRGRLGSRSMELYRRAAASAWCTVAPCRPA
jgi:hypothetical protein